MGMTRNQLKLIQAIAEKDLTAAKKAAIACCEEDTTRKNSYETKRLKSILESKGNNLMELPYNISQFASLEDLSLSFNEKRYFLTENAAQIYKQIRLMNEASLELMERGVPYLNATLLYGERGTGKTMLGRYIAYKLELPFFYVNFSQVISSLLGDTAKNLSRVIQYASQNRCLLMLDEIDCISTPRMDSGEGVNREMSRTTTCLIQLLDTMPNDVVIIGTTNLPENVDMAVKRRFTQQYQISRLSSEEAEKMIQNYLEDVGFTYDVCDVHTYASGSHTPAEIMTHMTQAMAEALIAGKEKLFIDINR